MCVSLQNRLVKCQQIRKIIININIKLKKKKENFNKTERAQRRLTISKLKSK